MSKSNNKFLLKSVCFFLVVIIVNSVFAFLDKVDPLSTGIKVLKEVDKKTKGNEVKEYKKSPEIKDKKLLSYIRSITEKIKKYEEDKIVYGDIYILDTNIVQASTSYLNEIRITKAMLWMITNEAELACLLGHELGHIKFEHIEKNILELINKKVYFPS